MLHFRPNVLWLNYFIAQERPVLFSYLLFGYLPTHKSFKMLSLSGGQCLPTALVINLRLRLPMAARLDSTRADPTRLDGKPSIMRPAHSSYWKMRLSGQTEGALRRAACYR